MVTGHIDEPPDERMLAAARLAITEPSAWVIHAIQVSGFQSTSGAAAIRSRTEATAK